MKKETEVANFGRLQIHCLVYMLEGCRACHALEANFRKVIEKNETAKACIDMKYLNYQFDPRTAEAGGPRVFPTVIVYQDGTPKLGWEGFANLAPNEIQEDMVVDVVSQMLQLIDGLTESSGIKI